MPAAANASSVGANTVYSSVPLSVATSSAVPRAATNEEWMVVAPAVIAMFTAGVHTYAAHSASLTVETAWVTVL